MNILLVCVAGMSTSLLVKKMEKEAAARNLQARIMAKPIDDLENVIDGFDVVLVGPQIKYKEKYVKEIAERQGKKYAVIPFTMYGMVDGKGALDLALRLMD
ncbi:lichenan-specific phosphotransferase enzyme IIB component [Peptococcaceae bacterium CEB3]|nr:lichenan-specific phosphotransferase enzyme IIB component [Peptococcaceae bacterium CEB3]